MAGCGAAFEVSVALHLADVVYQAIEQPLRVHLRSAAVAEAPQAARAAHVSEYGLGCSQPPAILVAPVLGVDLALHLGGIGFRFAGRAAGEEHHLAHRGALGTTQALLSQRARAAHALGTGELHRFMTADAAVGAVLIQKLTRWADAGLRRGVVDKVPRPEQTESRWMRPWRGCAVRHVAARRHPPPSRRRE